MTAKWPDETFDDDLRRLLRRARATSKRGIGAMPAIATSEQIVRMTEEGTLVLLEGEDVRLLRALQRRLAGPSRTASGMSSEEASSFLVQACDEAVARTINGAVERVRAALAEPVVEIEVTEPVDMLLPVRKLVVGHVTYREAPDRRLIVTDLARARGFVAPFASTRVATRGRDSAKVIARRRFAQSLAILDLVRPPTNSGPETTGLRDVAAPSGGVQFVRRGPWLDSRFVSGARLVAPFRQLALAASREEDVRTDWQRRLLAATRWYSKGFRNEAPADRLAGAMVALECLFVEGRNERTKGTFIAERLTDRFKLNEMTKEEQMKWLKRLYSGRNDAVHEGRDFINDLEVDRLFDLTRYTLVGLLSHLDSAHRAKGRACRTWVQAMRCSGPP
ncbi:MAG: hypothetical protein ACJ757_10655 [Gaiellaceae bacterium]